jgi:signal transduction histidine kinase
VTADGVATVLVAEDTRVNRLVLARGVAREGHRVVEAADGREALERLAERPVDMVLLDLLMPEVDGFAVLAAMAADADWRDIPVLVISAVEASEDVARALEMGAIDCLPKPVDPVLLRVRMRTALEQARLRRMEQDYLRQELALRQQERLATLGRLSAGLGHELNNPAAAALSAAEQLRDNLAEADRLLPDLLTAGEPTALLAAVDRLQRSARDRPVGDALDLEDDLVDVCTAAGVADPWRFASDLAAGAVDPHQLRSVAADLGADAGPAFAWLRSRLRITGAVDQIAGSVGRMAELTSALRGYSYLDRAPQQDVDVRVALDDTITILRHRVPDGVEVVRDYAPDAPVIHAFGGQLNQVWTNLLDNALDAVGREGTVTVRVERYGDGVAVIVTDDGPGIPAELQGRVFDPFVTTKPPGHGTGLGLSIAHQIVTDVHGGTLRVTSEPGATRFRTELPAVAAGPA